MSPRWLLLVLGTATTVGCKHEAPKQSDNSSVADSLTAVNYDLYIELWSRTKDEVLPDQKLTPPIGSLGGRRPYMPVLEPPSVNSATSADVVLDTSASARVNRQRTTVQSSMDDVERQGLRQWARQAGFKLQQTSTGQQEPTNTIVFGDSVAIDDVKALALEASHLGIRIQRIRSFATPGHEFLIELSSVHHAQASTPWTVEQIKGLARTENSGTRQ